MAEVPRLVCCRQPVPELVLLRAKHTFRRSKMSGSKSSVTLKLLEPRAGAVFPLGSVPVQTEPVLLRAVLREGKKDVSGSASFNWTLSWGATKKRAYPQQVATVPETSVRFDSGGGLLQVFALYDGHRYQDSVRIRITGKNPTFKQVAEKMGADGVLQALCWVESSWRQFDKKGDPLKSSVYSYIMGIGQINHGTWADNPAISHNDFRRVAWQWDYGLETTRDILAYLNGKARHAFPNADESSLLNQVLRGYNINEAAFRSRRDPAKLAYVSKIRRIMQMTKKPWEK